jgi:hypothetical protein
MHKQSLSVTINKGHHYVGQVCSWLPCGLLAKRGNVERIPHHVSFRASEMKLVFGKHRYTVPEYQGQHHHELASGKREARCLELQTLQFI